MLVLVVYDVRVSSEGGTQRLCRVAKQCVNYGQRVQNSVFECLLDPVQLKKLQKLLYDIIDGEKDSIRYYFFGKNWQHKVEHIGAKESYDPKGLLII